MRLSYDLQLVITNTIYFFPQTILSRKIVTQKEAALRKDFHPCTSKVGILPNKILIDLPFFSFYPEPRFLDVIPFLFNRILPYL